MRRHPLRSSCLALVALALVLGACAGETPKPADTTATIKTERPLGPPSDKLLMAIPAARPEWTVKTPEDAADLYFVGLSGDYATEKLAREDAMRQAQGQMVDYLGTLAKKKYEEIATSMNLASSVVDPTQASREYRKYLSANVVRGLKDREWYIELWQRATGNGYKAYGLTKIAKQTANDSMKGSAEENVRKAQEQAKTAADETAKKQAEQAIEFWNKMKDKGLVE